MTCRSVAYTFQESHAVKHHDYKRNLQHIGTYLLLYLIIVFHHYKNINKRENTGLVWDLNPGPIAPKPRIKP